MKESQITVAGMTIEKALIPQPKGPQYLRISVEVELPERRAQCQFLSVNVRSRQRAPSRISTINMTCRMRQTQLCTMPAALCFILDRLMRSG